MSIQYPDTVSIYDNMGIEAARHNNGMGGAFRFWLLGKAIDMQGSGKVQRDSLRTFILSLGVNSKTRARWENAALELGFTVDFQSSDGKRYFLLPSPGKVATTLGCQTVGRKLIIPVTFLIGKGWGGRMFAAWRHERHISQRTIKKLTNVSIRTQVYRNAQANPKRIKNIAKSEIPCKGANVHDLREFTGRSTLYITREGFAAWRLPDYCITPGVIIAGKGRAEKVNAEIQQNANREGLSLVGRALTSDERSEDEGCTYNDPVRIFCETERQQERAVKRIRQGTYAANDVYFCTKQKSPSGAIVWEHHFG